MNRILFLAQTRVVQFLSAVIIVAGILSLFVDVWAHANAAALDRCSKTSPSCNGFCPADQVCVSYKYGPRKNKPGCRCRIIIGPATSSLTLDAS